MNQPFKRPNRNSDGKITSYSWTIRYQLNGKEKWESLGKVGVITKTMAQKMLHERLRQVAMGLSDEITNRIPTLAEYKDEYIRYKREVKKNRSCDRDELSLKHLIRILGDVKLNTITSKDIKSYQFKRINEGVANATINRELSCLKNLFNEAKRDRKFFGDNPVSLVKQLDENNEKDRILSHEEELLLLNECNDHLTPIVITALNTGMRKMEILSLKWENVDLDNKLITILATNSKSKRTKYIPVNSTLKSELLRQRLKTGFQDYVFPTPEGENYKKADSLKSFKRACERAGLQGVTFHTLRHTFGTRGVEATGNIVAVSKILGHADLKTTMRYVHVDKTLYDTVENISNLNL